jgi:hypothetical protein
VQMNELGISAFGTIRAASRFVQDPGSCYARAWAQDNNQCRHFKPV